MVGVFGRIPLSCAAPNSDAIGAGPLKICAEGGL
jgi:hypothetical protein